MALLYSKVSMMGTALLLTTHSKQGNYSVSMWFLGGLCKCMCPLHLFCLRFDRCFGCFGLEMQRYVGTFGLDLNKNP